MEILDDRTVEREDQFFEARLEAVNSRDSPLIGLDKTTITIMDING